MFSAFRSWVRSLRPKSYPRSRGRSFLYRPDLEILEDRRLPSWTPIGPGPEHDPQNNLLTNTFQKTPGQDVAGRISALAIAEPTKLGPPTQLVAGAAGGGVWDLPYLLPNPAWQSSYDQVGFPTNPLLGTGAGALNIGALAVDPNNTARIIAGTGEANFSDDAGYGSGLYVSTDAGNSFKFFSDGGVNPTTGLPRFFRHVITKVVIDPRDSNRIYVALASDRLLSLDKYTGTDHSGVTTDGTNGTPDLTVDNGIWFTPDGGKSWKQLAGGTTNQISNPRQEGNIRVTDLDYTFVEGKFVLYAGVTSGLTTQHGGVWQSNDDGKTWSLSYPGMDDVLTEGRIALVASEDKTGTVYAVRTNANGSLFDVVARRDNKPWESIAPGNSLPSLFYTITVPFNSNQQETYQQGFYDLTLALNHKTHRLYLGGQGRMFEYDPGAKLGKRWLNITMNKPGPHADFHAIAIDEKRDKVFVASDGGVWEYDPGKKRGQIGTWSDLNVQTRNTLQVGNTAVNLNTITANAVALDPNNMGTMIEGSQDDGVGITTDNGKTWNTMDGGDGGIVRYSASGKTIYWIGAGAIGFVQNGEVTKVSRLFKVSCG